jgi:hypothetical protein
VDDDGVPGVRRGEIDTGRLENETGDATGLPVDLEQHVLVLEPRLARG